MKVAIQVAAKDSAKAADILVRHSPGMLLKNRIYIISEAAVKALRKAKVKFKELAREGNPPDLNGKVLGERI